MEVDNYLENKLQILGKVTASLIHEIRNPLSAIKLSIEYLQMIQNDLPDDVKESIKACSDATERIHSLVENLSTFTRKHHNKNAACSITDVTNDAVNILISSANGKGVAINRQLDKNLPLIFFDRNKLLQVLLNLMTNALEACERGGAITLRTYRKPACAGFFWEIEDTGIGISEDEKNKILNDFYTSKTKGTGLGLSVCQSILNDFECSLSFESTLGVGSRFIIQINENLAQGNYET
jgi:signal transduction histidine kinase